MPSFPINRQLLRFIPATNNRHQWDSHLESASNQTHHRSRHPSRHRGPAPGCARHALIFHSRLLCKRRMPLIGLGGPGLKFVNGILIVPGPSDRVKRSMALKKGSDQLLRVSCRTDVRAFIAAAGSERKDVGFHRSLWVVRKHMVRLDVARNSTDVDLVGPKSVG